MLDKERMLEIAEVAARHDLLVISDEIYDRDISLCFVQRLRETRKFSDAGALIKAIEQDVAQTRSILAGAEPRMVKPLLNFKTKATCS